MERAHFRDGDDVACTGKLYTAWIRRILLQCQVRASPMVITCEHLKVPRQTTLVEYHHVVKALATDCANDPFNIRTRLCRQLHRNATVQARLSGSLTRSTHGTAASSNWLRTRTHGVKIGSTSTTNISN